MANQDNSSKQASNKHAIAAKIVMNGRRLSEIHRLLDSYARTGAVPVPKKSAMPIDNMTRGDVARILTNFPPTIHKAKVKLRNLPKNSPEATQLRQNIEVWQQQLDQARGYKNEY